jgi:hypothetical protein
MSHPPPVETRQPTGRDEPTQFITNRPSPKNVLKLSWPKQAISINLERQIEVQKWNTIIEAVGPSRCNLGRSLEELHTEADKWKVLPAVFHTRAPSTLRKHAGAMNLYMKWCQTQGVDPFPLREAVTWNYCSFLFETCAPATRAESFVKAARATIELL